MEEADKETLVQQRIKKMLENKKRMQLKETGESMKMLKSGPGEKYSKEDEDQRPKLQSSLKVRRPVSAFKAAESTGIAQNQQIQIDVRSILVTAFEHGVKLSDFLKENRLEPNKYLQWLTNNELFLLSAASKLKEIPEEKQSIVLQRLCINKIGRELKMRQQLRKCEEAERRIQNILEQRIKNLYKHSNH